LNVPLAQVNIGLLANQVGVTAADTLDLGQGVHDLLLAVNIGVEQTQDVLEVRLLAGHERCRIEKKSSQPFVLSVIPEVFFPLRKASSDEAVLTALEPVSFPSFAATFSNQIIEE
jgi:hypothetical protein